MPADLADEIQVHRGSLLRVAPASLRDRDRAEDVVQDTLLAAFAGRDGFTGKSSVKTWRTGILKHTIVDAIRRRQRDLSSNRRCRRKSTSTTSTASSGGAASETPKWGSSARRCENTVAERPRRRAAQWEMPRTMLYASGNLKVEQSMNPQMEILVNGQRRALDASLPDVASLVRALGLEGKRIAVERNGSIVPKSRYAETPLHEGDRLEIVGAVGGG